MFFRELCVDPIVAIIVIAALVIGLGIGWLFGSRGAVPLRDELASVRDRAGTAEREAAGQLQLHGCWFGIAAGTLYELDEQAGHFQPVPEDA